MTPLRWLLAYAAAVVGVSLLHDPHALAVGLLLALLAVGQARWALLRRCVLAVLVVNGAVSAGVLATAAWHGRALAGVLPYLATMNLRVLLLVLLGSWFVSRVNVLQALAFSPTLQFVATLAAGQVMACTRLVRDHALAFRSRTPGAPGLPARSRHAAATAGHLLDQAVARAAVSALAVRARGGSDD